MGSSVKLALEKLSKQIMLDEDDREALREMRRNEEGTEPPCPMCGRPRVKRSDYIRCNPCATNWLDEERDLPDYLNLDPRVARLRGARLALASTGSKTASPAGAQVEDAEELIF